MQRINPEAPLTEYERNKRYYLKHRTAELERNRQYHRNSKTKINARVRLFRHGMTIEEHDSLLMKQDHKCAICRNTFLKTPHIDHCHRTGINRGLLCDDCNLGLGRFKDDVRVLQAAIEYLAQRTVDGN